MKARKKAESRSIYCVIPARYGSTRLPGKPLKEIKGRPLVMWAYDCARSAGVFDKILVATDDRRIAESVESHGGAVVMTSASHRSGTDRVLEAVQADPCDFVVNLQGDEPDFPGAVLAEFAFAVRGLDDKSLFTVAVNATINEIKNPNVVKVVLDAQGKALYFSRSAIPYDREPAGEKAVFLKHKGVYGFTRAGLRRFCAFPEGVLERRENLEQLRALEFGMSVRCLVRDFHSAGIDTPEDLASFEADVTRTERQRFSYDNLKQKDPYR